MIAETHNRSSDCELQRKGAKETKKLCMWAVPNTTSTTSFAYFMHRILV